MAKPIKTISIEAVRILWWLITQTEEYASHFKPVTIRNAQRGFLQKRLNRTEKKMAIYLLEKELERVLTSDWSHHDQQVRLNPVREMLNWIKYPGRYDVR